MYCGTCGSQRTNCPQSLYDSLGAELTWSDQPASTLPTELPAWPQVIVAIDGRTDCSIVQIGFKTLFLLERM